MMVLRKGKELKEKSMRSTCTLLTVINSHFFFSKPENKHRLRTLRFLFHRRDYNIDHVTSKKIRKEMLKGSNF